MILCKYLHQEQVHFSYPDWIMNTTALDQYYSELDIQPGESFYKTMVQKVSDFYARKQMEMLFSTVDRTDFGGSPIDVNAWYRPEVTTTTTTTKPNWKM